MSEIRLCEPTWVDGNWVPDVRKVMGEETESPPQLKGWISLGQPVAVPLTVAQFGNDPAIRQFLETSPDAMNYRFHLVTLACTFHPEEDEPIVSAWLAVQLKRADGSAGEQPIAWSMEPKKVGQPVKLTSTAKLQGALKIKGFGIEAGLTPTEEEKIERERPEVICEALNELQSDPTWEFRRQEVDAIFGGFRFALVVRSRDRPATEGRVHLRATVQKTKWKIFTYYASFGEVNSLNFLL
jgi:hypothetical protein